jgi:hypothetical protein
MYMVFYSSGIGGVFLLLAILLRARSQRLGQERMRQTLRMTAKGISQEEVDEIFLKMEKDDDDTAAKQ